MSKPQVFVTRRIPEPGLALLREACDVRVNPHDRVLNADELMAAAEGCDGLLCLLTDTVNRSFLKAVRPRVVANLAAGVDNIDLAAATEFGIPVTNTPGAVTEATADFTWALMLAAARRLGEGERYVRRAQFTGWSPTLMLGCAMHERTLGIVGLGRIGQAVARRASGFGMQVLYHQRRRDLDAEAALGVRFCDLAQLLSQSDFVSLHTPLTPETRHLIGADEIASMRPSAVLVNTARGEVVDAQALREALHQGHLAGVGLDVYQDEASGIDPRWFDTPRVTLAPHLGSATREARDTMARMAARDLLLVLDGKRPLHLVNTGLKRFDD